MSDSWSTDAKPDIWQTRRMPVMPSMELRRIAALPRREPPAPGSVESLALVRLMTGRFRRDNSNCDCASRKRECIKELREIQAWTLWELNIYGSCLGLIGTGFGKTLLDLLAILALKPHGVQTGCLLIPPTLMLQLIHDYQHISNHFQTPSLQVHGRGETNWSHTVDGAPILHVFPYSRLQRAENSTWLETLSPDLIIADEADYLSNVDTATTSRVIRALQRKPTTIFLPWSGSITDTSIKDYWHLSAFALRQNSPLPIVKEVIEDWARAIDPSDDPAPEGALIDLYSEGDQNLYDAFHHRLIQTPGVIHTFEASVDVPLRIGERTLLDMPEVVREALLRLRRDWTRPDYLAEGYLEGSACEEFVSALEVNACAIQLACGFFYRWKFPRGESESLIRNWLEARALYKREVRQKLKQRIQHCDSELLCKEAAMRAWGDLPHDPELPEWKAEHWPRWRDLQDQVKPETEAILIHDFLAEDAANWALEEKGIVWYEARAFGKRVSELSGLPLHGGGSNAGARILAETGANSIVASISSHGRGRDGLQRIFSTQLVTQPPSNPAIWEQMLARLSRPGQNAPFVEAYFYRHTQELDQQIKRALMRAKYVAGTTGAAQKLLNGFL